MFTDIDIPLDYYQDVMKRQAVVNAGVTFRLRSEVSPGRFETQDFLYENGIRDYLAELAGDRPHHPARVLGGGAPGPGPGGQARIQGEAEHRAGAFPTGCT